MSVDTKFLEKWEYFNSCLSFASDRNHGVDEYKTFTGLDPNFCNWVIKNSEIITTSIPKESLEKTTLDMLCGMLTTTDELNRYYYMTGDIRALYDDQYYYYTLKQHHNGDWPIIFNMKVKKEYMNKYLTYALSFVDRDCLNATLN